MGVVKQNKNKTKKEEKKELSNGKSNDVKKVKKKKFVSCLQCIKPGKEDGTMVLLLLFFLCKKRVTDRVA